MKETVTIQFDGGCKGNPGLKYGSYMALFDGVFELREDHFQLGYGTNNEAEFEALLRCLTHINSRTTWVQILARYKAQIVTDSMIVKFRLNKNRSDGSRMFKLAEQCLELLAHFKKWEVKWEPREKNVEMFGH